MTHVFGCWQQHKILGELRDKFGAICVWPPQPTKQFRVYDVLIRKYAKSGPFMKVTTLKGLFVDEKAYKAAIEQEDLKPKDFKVTSTTLRDVDWKAGLKAMALVAPNVSAKLDTSAEGKGHLEFNFDNITTIECPDRLKISKALMVKNLLSQADLEALNSGYIWVVVQTISCGKFECKVTGEKKGSVTIEGKTTLPGGVGGTAAPSLEGDAHVEGGSKSSTEYKYDDPAHPLIVAFVCWRYQVKDGQLVKPVIVTMGQDDKEEAKETEVESWFDAHDFDAAGSVPYFSLELAKQGDNK